MTVEARPLMTVDMDGVFCEPPFGINLGIKRTWVDPDAPAPEARVYPHWVHASLDHLRFDFRRPMPGARDALLRLGTVRRLIVVTGRRSYPRWWLRHYGFEGLFEAIYVNESRLPSAYYKQATLRRLNPTEHVEDDPRTAQLLAVTTDVRPYLCDWPRNRVPLDGRIVRVADLRALADRLAP